MLVDYFMIPGGGSNSKLIGHRRNFRTLLEKGERNGRRGV